MLNLKWLKYSSDIISQNKKVGVGLFSSFFFFFFLLSIICDIHPCYGELYLFHSRCSAIFYFINIILFSHSPMDYIWIISNHSSSFLFWYYYWRYFVPISVCTHGSFSLRDIYLWMKATFWVTVCV